MPEPLSTALIGTIVIPLLTKGYGHVLLWRQKDKRAADVTDDVKRLQQMAANSPTLDPAWVDALEKVVARLGELSQMAVISDDDVASMRHDLQSLRQELVMSELQQSRQRASDTDKSVADLTLQLHELKSTSMLSCDDCNKAGCAPDSCQVHRCHGFRVLNGLQCGNKAAGTGDSKNRPRRCKQHQKKKKSSSK